LKSFIKKGSNAEDGEPIDGQDELARILKGQGGDS